MSEQIITPKQVTKWFDELEDLLKNQIIRTKFDDGAERERLYHLYQASQLLKAGFLGDCSTVVEPKHNIV